MAACLWWLERCKLAFREIGAISEISFCCAWHPPSFFHGYPLAFILFFFLTVDHGLDLHHRHLLETIGDGREYLLDVLDLEFGILQDLC